jgi:hypothetical protein
VHFKYLYSELPSFVASSIYFKYSPGTRVWSASSRLLFSSVAMNLSPKEDFTEFLILGAGGTTSAAIGAREFYPWTIFENLHAKSCILMHSGMINDL